MPLNNEGAVLGQRTLPLVQGVRAALSKENATTATVGFRPESVRLVGEGEGFPFEVVVVEELGSDAYAYGTLHTGAAGSEGDRLTTIRVDARKPPQKGETVYLQIAAEELHVFSPQSGRRITAG
jgi:multiple sugar transport system ATP-binding protein